MIMECSGIVPEMRLGWSPSEFTAQNPSNPTDHHVERRAGREESGLGGGEG